jgi:small subunit ribosomal protein S8
MKNYLWNMFASIKNAQIVNKSFILCPSKKISIAFLNVLWDEGFILGYKVLNTTPKALKIFLKYKNGRPVINSLSSITRPGNRIYYSAQQLWKLNSNNSLTIISTNKGLLTLNECRKLNEGGEPFLTIK